MTNSNNDKCISSINRWVIALVFIVAILTISTWLTIGRHYLHANSHTIQPQNLPHSYIATAHAEGELQKLHVLPGATVKKGQVLAEINQKKLQREFAHQQQYVETLQQHFTNLKSENEKRQQALLQYHQHLSRNIAETKQHVKKNRDILEQLLKGKRKLQKKGYVSIVQLNMTQNDYFDAKERLKNLQSEMSNLKLQERTDATQWLQTKNQIEVDILHARNQLDELKYQLTENEYIKSPINGTVLKVMQSTGSIVEAGTPIMSITHQ